MNGGLNVIIPGGLECDGLVHREVGLKPITGFLEQSISEAADAASNQPARVSYVLTKVMRNIANREVDSAAVESLCVADRQYLMLRLAQLFEGDQIWLQPTCVACSSPFDVGLLRSNLPIQEAGPDFPYALASVNGYEVKLHVPTGADQEKIANLQADSALKQLLSLCIDSVHPEISVRDLVDSLTTENIEQIDASLEASSPAVCTTIITQCPECNKEQTVTLDPYDVIHRRNDSLYHQVHTIAYHYHWSEPDILALPQSRRQRYLRYIDQAQGVYS